MADRRMFAKTIIDSDAFLDMPVSSQALYFHLSMRADDDGFLNNPKKIQRLVGGSDDDLRVLAAKAFIIPFESGVIVIKHWRMSNYLRLDRYKPTVYQDEFKQLEIKENGAYTRLGNQLATSGIPDGNQLATQVRLGKGSIDNTSPAKPSKDKYSESFNQFWEAYPRHEGKGQAAKVYASKIKKRITPDEIQSRLAVYKAQIEAAGTEPQYIRYPATFLNNLDDYHESARPQPKESLNECLPYREKLQHVTLTQEEREMIARSYEVAQ